MNLDSETITCRPQHGAWVLFLFGPLFAAAFAFGTMQYEIKPIWWAPPLILLILAILSALFSKPYKIVFVPANRTMKVHYRLKIHPTCYAFEELESIHSCDTFGGEGDTYIQLMLRLKNGNSFVLITTTPVWGTFLSGYKESEEISDFRKKIATMVGISDLGFKPNLK